MYDLLGVNTLKSISIVKDLFAKAKSIQTLLFKIGNTCNVVFLISLNIKISKLFLYFYMQNI